jgi:hypothetical protein
VSISLLRGPRGIVEHSLQTGQLIPYKPPSCYTALHSSWPLCSLSPLSPSFHMVCQLAAGACRPARSRFIRDWSPACLLESGAETRVFTALQSCGMAGTTRASGRGGARGKRGHLLHCNCSEKSSSQAVLSHSSTIMTRTWSSIIMITDSRNASR